MTTLSGRTRFRYSLGSFVTGSFGTVPGLILVKYLTDTMAVPAAAAGVIVFVPKAWDVLFNPIAGRMSDANLLKTGSRRRFLLIGGIGVSILFALMFAHPGFGSPLPDALYVAILFTACATAYAVFQVPFNALLGRADRVRRRADEAHQRAHRRPGRDDPDLRRRRPGDHLRHRRGHAATA